MDRKLPENIREKVHYDPETGVITYLVGRCEGETIHKRNRDGYLQVALNNSYFGAHRIAWFYMTGEWPEKDIDHKNRIPDDNRWENLRLATKQENGFNRGPNKTNTSGYKGVFANQKRNGNPRPGWDVRIQVNKKKKFMGTFLDKDDAARFYNKVVLEVYGEFAYLNDVPDKLN